MVKKTLWLLVPIAKIIFEYNILKLTQHGQKANIFHVPCRFEQQRKHSFVLWLRYLAGGIFVMRWKVRQIYFHVSCGDDFFPK